MNSLLLQQLFSYAAYYKMKLNIRT